MQATIDIPDPLYKVLQHKAASEGKSIGEIILDRMAEPASAEPATISEAAKEEGPNTLPFELVLLSNGRRIPVIRSSRTDMPAYTPNDLFDFDEPAA